MSAPAWLKKERCCKYCAEGRHSRKMVCCSACWRGLPRELRQRWDAVKFRGDDSAKIAALRAIAEHLCGQPELKL